MPDADVIRREAQQVLQTLPARVHQVLDAHCRTQPDRPALRSADRVWTYRELDRVVRASADALTTLGVRGGDRVMIVSENSLPLAALVLAASRIDAWPVIVNPRLSARELDQIREHCGARRVLLVVEGSDAAMAHAQRLQAATAQAFAGLGQPMAALAVSPLNDAVTPEPVEHDDEGARQVAALLYTSGTTGQPKGVMLTHQNVLFSAAVSGRMRGVGPADCIYGVLPMSHIVGFSIVLVSSLMHGASALLVPRYEPAAFAASLAHDGVTLVYGVPATYQRLLEYEAAQPTATRARGALRGVFVAGAPLDLTLKQQVEQRFGQPLYNGYGITECSPGISGVTLAAPSAGTDVGPIITGVQARLIGLDGQPVADGEVGELHVRGPNVMRGYYRAPELTAKAIDAQGWFNTGDLARFDGRNLSIAGRTKELIIRSGFNVYPAEVEAVLATHPDVVQSAVIGRAVPGNEEVVAYVQLRAGSPTDAAELSAYAAERLTAYKRPSEVIILAQLPASSTGKILKHQLAASTTGR